MRQYHERLILHTVRRFGEIPSADLVRETGLSVQSVSRIVNRLLGLELLEKRERRRVKGKVGQPSVPLALKPESAYAIGVKIGRTSLDIVAIDFEGKVQGLVEHKYGYPDPAFVLPQVHAGITSILSGFSAAQQARIVGIGVVAPYGLGERRGEMKSPASLARKWASTDVRAAVETEHDFPVWYEHDAKAACLADMLLHRPTSRPRTYLYVFLGTIVGGGMVVDGTLWHGPYGYAGAIGPMPVPASLDPKAASERLFVVPLLRVASRYVLNEMLAGAGYEPGSVLPSDAPSEEFTVPEEISQIVDDWIERASDALGIAILSAISTIDLEAVVVDGALPAPVLANLVARVTAKMDQHDFTGLIRPQLVRGDLGNRARAMGGALLPLYSKFAPERELLFKAPETQSIASQ